MEARVNRRSVRRRRYGPSSPRMAGRLHLAIVRCLPVFVWPLGPGSSLALRARLSGTRDCRVPGEWSEAERDTDLGHARDRQLNARKSGGPDLRGPSAKSAKHIVASAQMQPRMRPATWRLFRNLHQVFELARSQRLAQKLELDRIGHQVAQPHHPVWNHHLLGIEFLAHPPRVLDADLGEFRVDLRRLLARIHPIHRLAIGTHEAAIDVGLAVEARLVGDDHADRVSLHQWQVARARDDADLALA